MNLITDYATPFELSTVARQSAIERERAENKLSTVLPNVDVDGITITLESGEDGRVEVAEYRAFDAETSFGHTESRGKRQIVELAPLGQQRRVSEYDQLIQRNASTPERVKQVLGRASLNLGRAVADRLEMARGQVLQTGKIKIDENGFKAEVDFGRDESMTANATVKWYDKGADGIQQIMDWVEAYNDLNGELPERIFASRKAITALKKLDVFGKVVNDKDAAYQRRVTFDDIQAFLESENLPVIEEYNRKVLRNGKMVDVLDPNTIVFVPDVSLGAGSTAFGTTLESLSPRYGMAPGEEAGIVVGNYQSDNPMGLYLNSAAIGLPVLHDANRFMAATVL